MGRRDGQQQSASLAATLSRVSVCLFHPPLTFPRRDSLPPPAAELVGLSGEEEEDEVDVDEDARPEAMPRGLVVLVPSAPPLGHSPPSSSSAASAAGCMTSHSPTWDTDPWPSASVPCGCHTPGLRFALGLYGPDRVRHGPTASSLTVTGSQFTVGNEPCVAQGSSTYADCGEGPAVGPAEHDRDGAAGGGAQVAEEALPCPWPCQHTHQGIAGGVSRVCPKRSYGGYGTRYRHE